MGSLYSSFLFGAAHSINRTWPQYEQQISSISTCKIVSTLAVVRSYSPFDQLNFMLNQLFITRADLIGVSFYWWIFAKFGLEKYDFNLYKGFFSWKVLPKLANFLKKKNSNRQISTTSSSIVAKKIKGFSFFPLLPYVIYSQIWLNYFLDYYHFDYITKSLKETLDLIVEPWDLYVSWYKT
jgi:hypothetical protein